MTSGNLGTFQGSDIHNLTPCHFLRSHSSPNWVGKRVFISSTSSLPEPLGNRSYVHLNENKLLEMAWDEPSFAEMWAIGTEAKMWALTHDASLSLSKGGQSDIRGPALMQTCPCSLTMNLHSKHVPDPFTLLSYFFRLWGCKKKYLQDLQSCISISTLIPRNLRVWGSSLLSREP